MHKYYISLCEIEYIEEQQSLQITLGLFIDDLEFTLNKNYETTLNIASKEENEHIDKLYKTYLNDNFKISINGTSATYTFIGKEYDDDIVRFYLEITNVEKLDSIGVINSSLVRDFEDQQNIVKIKAEELYKTYYLNARTNNFMLKF